MMDDKVKYPPFEICEKVLFIMAAEVFNILITHNVKLTGITVNCHNLLMTLPEYWMVLINQRKCT